MPPTTHSAAPAREFSISTVAEPHRARAREILRRHPGLSALAGRNAWSAPLAALLVVAQVGAAWALSGQPLWLIVAVAFAFGAFVDHTLWVLIHECAHNLVFRRGLWNRLVAIGANLPHLLPSAASFRNYHLKHHAHQGVYELDADIPNRWEARLVGYSTWRKAIWLALFPIFQVTRPSRLKEIALFDRWVVLNILLQVAFDIGVFLLLGPRSLAYLALSFFFSVGLHPLGARWIQEHFLVFGQQETASYYGALNRVALNVGFHNEHHDFPSVPWNRLPEIRRAVPEVYDQLGFHTSWTRLLLRFLLDPGLGLWSRTVRSVR